MEVVVVVFNNGNSLASNIFFYWKFFQNGIDFLSKLIDAFLSQSSKFYIHM